MIVALEGYHGSGKSTLFTDLKAKLGEHDHIFWVQFSKREWPPAATVWEYNVVEMFTMLYRSDQLYIFDRLWPITAVVYNRIRRIVSHPLVENPPWLKDVRVFRLSGGRCDQFEEEQYTKRLDELIEKGIDVVRLPLVNPHGRVVLAIAQIEKWYGSRL